MTDQQAAVQQARTELLDLTLAAFKESPNPVVEAYANKLADAFQDAILDAEHKRQINQPILRNCLHPGCLRQFDVNAAMDGRPTKPSRSSQGWLQIRPTVATGYVCPDHADVLEQHRPKWSERESGKAFLCCSCGWAGPPARWQGYAVAAWQNHLLDTETTEETQ